MIPWDKEHYHLRDGKLRWRAYDIKGADVATFEPLNHIWARDAKHVYTQMRVSKLADRATFEVLNYIFARDKNNIFYLAGTLKGADVKSFRVLDSGRRPTAEWARVGTNDWTYEGFACDANNVYWDDMLSGKPCALKGADVQSFQLLSHGFVRDARYVWHNRWRLPGAKPDAFRVLNPSYGTDGKGVFYAEIPMPEAEAATFEALMDFWARDAHLAFFQRSPIPNADAKTFRVHGQHFASDARHVYRFLGEVVPHIDAATFERVGQSDYCRDRQHVFWRGKTDRVRGAHAPSFEVFIGDKVDARDRSSLYRLGDRVGPRE
jgi:hypothetical protein